MTAAAVRPATGPRCNLLGALRVAARNVVRASLGWCLEAHMLLLVVYIALRAHYE